MFKIAMPASVAAALIGLAVCAMPAPAQAQSAGEMTERLRSLYLAHITAEICAVDLPDARIDALNETMGDLEEKLKLTDTQADELFAKVSAEVEAVDTAQLCDKQSKWMKGLDAAVKSLPQ